MNKNVQLAVKACKQLKIPFKLIHRSKNILEISKNNKSFLFINHTNPLNYQSESSLLKDKDFFYTYVKNDIKMPKSISYLSPFVENKFIKYLKHKSIKSIIDNIEKSFIYPFIIKKNKGSQGNGVFLVNNIEELKDSILKIFKSDVKALDYVCIGQELINTKKEYRCIFLNGKHKFSYYKNNTNAIFKGNLSPLHWQGAVAEVVKDKKLINNIIKFTKPLFKKLKIKYCGLDIVIDNKGVYWLIEANSSPILEIFTRDNGDTLAIKLYKDILKELE